MQTIFNRNTDVRCSILETNTKGPVKANTTGDPTLLCLHNPTWNLNWICICVTVNLLKQTRAFTFLPWSSLHELIDTVTLFSNAHAIPADWQRSSIRCQKVSMCALVYYYKYVCTIFGNIINPEVLLKHLNFIIPNLIPLHRQPFNRAAGNGHLQGSKIGA